MTDKRTKSRRKTEEPPTEEDKQEVKQVHSTQQFKPQSQALQTGGSAGSRFTQRSCDGGLGSYLHIKEIPAWCQRC